MADENYTIEVNTKISGDLQDGLEKVSKYAKKTVVETDKLGKEIKQIDPKPIRDLQKASEQFGKTMNKLKPKSLNDMATASQKLNKSINAIKPKALLDTEKAASRMQKQFDKVKPKKFGLLATAVNKVKSAIDKVKPKPFNDVLRASDRLKASLGGISAKPLTDLSGAAQRLREGLNRIRATPFRAIADMTERANSRILTFMGNLLLMGNNLQGLVLLAVNRLRAAFVDLTDQLNRVIGQMEKWAETAEKAAELVDALQSISVETGWDLDDLSSTFTKLGTVFQDLGLSTAEVMRLTRGLGLLFRQVGADGDKMANVAGKISQLFAKETPSFTNLEALLGRGRYEQILKSLADELLRLKDIDLTHWANRGMTALAVLRREMGDGAITGADLAKAWINLLDKANDLGIVATEIGHGFDQLTRATTVMVTRFDQAVGLSNTLAAVFSHMAFGVKWLADNVGKLLKLGLVTAMAVLALNLKKVYGWLKKIGKLTGGWATKLKPILVILGGIAASFLTVKAAAAAMIGALVLFGKELDKIVDKSKDKIESFSPTLFTVLKAITKALSKLEDIFDRLVNKKDAEKAAEAGTTTKGGKPPTTMEEIFSTGGSPSQIRTRKKTPEEEATEKAISDKAIEDVEKKIAKIVDRAKSLRATLKLELPGKDVRLIHENMKSNFRDLLNLQTQYGKEFAKSPELRGKYTQAYNITSRFRGGTKDPGSPIEPDLFFTGLRGVLAQIMKETKNLIKFKSHFKPEEFESKMQALIQRRKDALVQYGGEVQLRGLTGRGPHDTGTVKQYAKLVMAQAKYDKGEKSDVYKAVMELADRQAKSERAYERGDQTYEEHKREQQGFTGEVTKLQRKYTDELALGEPTADKEALLLGDTLGEVAFKAAEFDDPEKTLFSPFIERMEKLNSAFKQGVIDGGTYHAQMDSLNKSYLDVAVANLDLIKTDRGLISELKYLNENTKESVKFMHPVAQGTRKLSGNLHNLMEAQDAGFISGKKMVNQYVALNDSARDYRAANAKLLKQNPELLRTVNMVIQTTDKWRKVLEKIPEPKGGFETFSQTLGFGPAEGETDPKKIQQGMQERQQAAGILQQGATTAVDRIYSEGTQGRDFGPAGDIGADFTKNLITMGPALATLKAALDVIIEILVQAADFAHLFGAGLQEFFDPINRLITLIASTLSPLFNMLGDVFAFIGGVLDGFVSILKPFLDLIKAILKPFQAIFRIFKVLGQLFKQIGQAIGAVIKIALQPLIDAFMWLAEAIISLINWIIRGYNSVVRLFGMSTLDEVTLEGERHIPEEEKEKEKDKEEKKDRKKGLNISAQMLAALKRMNKVLEKEAAARAQAAREVVRVKEIGSITEARARGVISQDQTAESPQPLAVRIVNVNDPREIAAALATSEGERAVLNVNRRNAPEMQEMMLR